jgi:hypothetical protein
MAKVVKDENGDGGKTENVTDSNALIAEALMLLAKNQPAKVISADSPEWQEHLRAEGFYDAFSKPVYQNGREASPRGLSEQTRERASNLRPGKYLAGMVVIEEAQNGGVHIKYKSASTDDRMKYASKWRDFSDLVDQVWNEMHVTA